jgi:hypothetical protein
MTAWLLVLAAWAGVAAIFMGIGLAAWRALRPESPDRCSPFVAFWVGWAVVLVFLELWHFALPVDGWVYAVLVPASLAGWLTGRSQLARPMPGPPGVMSVTLGLAAVVIGFAAARALMHPLNPDTCAYHMQTVRWDSTFPVVRGLGNLGLPLAFNNAYHLYVAMLDVGPLAHRAQHVANGVLFLSAGLPGLAATVSLVTDRSGRPVLYRFLWAIQFGLCLDELLAGANLSSPSADGSVWATNVVISMLGLEPALKGKGVSGHRLRLLLFVSAAAIANKGSAIVIALPVCALATISWWRSEPRTARTALRFAGAAAGLVALPLVPWSVSNVLLSGYPFFPSAALPVQVPWRVPAVAVHQLMAYIQAFARYRRHVDGVVDPDYAWRLDWLNREWLNNREFLVPALLLAVGLLILIARLLASRRLPRLWAPVLALLAALLLWWWGAPDLRFLAPLQWTVAALAVGAALEGVRRERPLLIAMALAVQATAFIQPPGAMTLPGGLEPPHEEDFEAGQLASGEPVHVRRGCCLELPCAEPGKAEHAHTFTSGQLQGGFYSDLLERR